MRIWKMWGRRLLDILLDGKKVLGWSREKYYMKGTKHNRLGFFTVALAVNEYIVLY